jgi:glucosamine--fructose-6-phosphate aminotransferase (isomerizing)
MLKEIYEQPRAIADTIAGRIREDQGEVFLAGLNLDDVTLKGLDRIYIVACGTSWHAALVGKFMIEKHARIPVEVDIASEFRYRDPLVNERTLTILISQSGETADTLAALREAHGKAGKVLAICNVVESSIARESDGVIYTHAGPEIGVASTKAFTTQLIALYLFTLHIGRVRGLLDKDACRLMLDELISLPRKVEQCLELYEAIENSAHGLMHAQDFLYLGRGNQYPIALEGAFGDTARRGAYAFSRSARIVPRSEPLIEPNSIFRVSQNPRPGLLKPRTGPVYRTKVARMRDERAPWAGHRAI